MADEPKTVEPGTEPVKPEEKTFTQSQLDAIIKDRLARATKEYSDYEDIKKKAETLEAERKKREEAELTENEKLKKDLEEAQRKADEIALEKEQLSKFKTDWEERETEKVNKAMEDLSEDVKGEINSLPLEKRMFFINQLKGTKPSNGEWGKKPREGDEITIDSIMAKKARGDQSWRADFEKYKKMKPKTAPIMNPNGQIQEELLKE